MKKKQKKKKKKLGEKRKTKYNKSIDYKLTPKSVVKAAYLS